jgi:hypothetical protein
MTQDDYGLKYVLLGLLLWPLLKIWGLVVRPWVFVPALLILGAVLGRML